MVSKLNPLHPLIEHRIMDLTHKVGDEWGNEIEGLVQIAIYQGRYEGGKNC